MKILAFFCISLLSLAVMAQQPAASPDKLVYADFENSTAEHITSSRGGNVQVVGWQANAGMAAKFTPVFLESGGCASKCMAFNYTLQAPQQYTGTALMISGLPEVDGKTQPEDLTGYKELTFQMEAAGPHYVRVQFLSQKTGLTVIPGFEPFYEVEVKPGLQTYHVPMKKVDTPNGTPPFNASAKSVMKQVTGVQFVVNEAGSSGHLVIDNVTLVK